MDDLFNIPEVEYKLQQKVQKLRRKIKERTAELNITTDHSDLGHFYLFNGKKFKSVTARLQLLKDPALMNWKMNRALEHIKTYWFPNTPYTDEQIQGILTGAGLAPQIEFEGAGSIGSRVHKWREEFFARVIAGEDVRIEDLNLEDVSEVISGCRAIVKFKKETGYHPIACEMYVADEKLEIGGTADDIGLMDGKLTFLDLKTSNIGDKDSYFYQVALYVAMFERLYKMRTQAWKILHVSKTDATYKLIDIPDIRKRIREAKQIIKVDKFLEDLRIEKKKQSIVI